jgi:hypothetical protein
MTLDASGVSHWIIQRSEDGGVSWTIKDVFKGNGTTSVVSLQHRGRTWHDVRIRSSWRFVHSGHTRQQVFRRLDGLAQHRPRRNWQIVDSWVPKTSGSSRARKVATDGARVFVLGDTGGRTEKDPSPWVVRMTDGGNAWQTIFGPWTYGPCVYPSDFSVDASGMSGSPVA